MVGLRRVRCEGYFKWEGLVFLGCRWSIVCVWAGCIADSLGEGLGSNDILLNLLFSLTFSYW